MINLQLTIPVKYELEIDYCYIGYSMKIKNWSLIIENFLFIFDKKKYLMFQ